VKLIIDLIPAKHNIPKDLYQSKKIVAGLGMNYEKIDVCERNCMVFWMEHKDDTECMHCDRSRYVKVVNEDGASVTIKVEVKQLRYKYCLTVYLMTSCSKGTLHTVQWCRCCFLIPRHWAIHRPHMSTARSSIKLLFCIQARI
jgi:hypothetical protein